MASLVRFRSVAFLSALTVLLVLTASAAAKPTAVLAGPSGDSHGKPSIDTAVFFAADGMRQDLVAKYAAQGLMPTMSTFLKQRDVGDRQRAADPGAAEHRRRLVQPRDGRLAGRPRLDEQHVPHQRPAVREPHGGLRRRTCSRPSRSPSRPSAAGSRSPRSSGPAGATPPSRARRSTSSRSSPAAASRRTSSASAGEPLFDDAPFIAAFGLQFDHPAGYAGQAPFPGAAPDAGDRLDRTLPDVVQPGEGDAAARARLRRRQVRPQRLDLRQHQRRHDELRQGALLAHEERAPTPSAPSRKGEWADVKVKIVGGALDGQTAGMLVKVEELTADLSRVRLFHTSVSRAIASWPTWPGEPGFTGDFAEYLAQKFPTSTAADFAILEAGVTSARRRTSSRACTGRPATSRCSSTSRDVPARTCCWSACRRRTSSSTSSSGSSRRSCRTARPNPAYDDVDLNGVPDGRVAAREGFIRTAYEEADEVLTLARELIGKDPTTFVASDHGFAPQFLAIDASQPLVELGLLSTAADVELPPGHRRDDRQGEGLLGRRRAADLPQRRRPRSRPAAASRRSPRPTSPRRSRRSRPSTSA